MEQESTDSMDCSQECTSQLEPVPPSYLSPVQTLLTNSLASPCQQTTEPVTHTEDDGEPLFLSYNPLHPPHCLQVSIEEYQKQAVSYTQQTLKELQASPDYRQHTERCHSCGASWYNSQWTQGCRECGECAMHKPCPICRGTCGRVWKRELSLSHNFSEAHWDGDCGHKDAAARIVQLLYMNSVTDAMEELHT